MFAIDVTVTAYRFVFSNLKSFLVLGSIPIVMLAALFVLQDAGWMDDGIGGVVPRIIIEALFALFWHRFYLLGYEQTWWRGAPRDSSKEDKEAYSKVFKKFLIWSIGMWAAFLIVMLLLGMFIGLAMTAKSTGFVYLLLVLFLLLISPIVFRVLPFFPAIAVGGLETRIGDTIGLTAGYTARIWMAFVLTLIPATVFVIGVALFVTDAIELPGIPLYPKLIVLNLLMATSSMFVLAVGVSANSEIFRRLSNFERPQAATSIPGI